MGNSQSSTEISKEGIISNKMGCTRCKGDTKSVTPLFKFRPMAFEELFVNCVRDKRSDACLKLPVPEPRSGHRIVCEDSNMFCFGGYSQAKTTETWPASLSHGRQRLFQELWCYNYAEGQWKKLPTLGSVPKELASHSVVLHGNFLVVFGGSGVPFGSSSSNQMHVCDLRTFEWSTIETEGSPPTPQYGQAVLMDNATKSFYVIGGTTGFDYCLDIHKLDMTTFVWETMFISSGDSGRLDLDEPDGRYRHEVAFDGTNIYIIGGGTATTAYDLINVPTFNVHSKTWKTISTVPCNEGSVPYPVSRKCQEKVQIGNDVFICGGFDSISIFKDVWKLHLPSMQWTLISVTMPVPLYFHSASLTDAGCMYIFGGVTHIKNSTRTNRLFKIWLKVPNLSEMCWEALLHYNKSIQSAPYSVLLDMGIPKEFATRAHPANFLICILFDV